MLICVAAVSSQLMAQSADRKDEHFGKLGSSSSKGSMVKIRGQVFIATNGGQNIKLGLVDVSAYTSSDFEKKINSIAELGREMRKNLLAISNDRLQKFSDLDAEFKKFESEYQAASLAYFSNKNDEQARDRYADLGIRRSGANSPADLLESARLELNSSLHAIDGTKKLGFYTQKLKGPVDSGKSDADGNFELTLPAGKYVFVANAKRMISGENEFYDWIVKVNVNSQTKRIMLGNDNSLGTNCDDCYDLGEIVNR